MLCLALLAWASSAILAATPSFSVSYTATQFKLFGLAHFERNPLCPDGFMIDQIGFGAANYCTIDVTVPADGVYTINFQGETEYPRGLFLWLGAEGGPQSSGSGTIYNGTSFKTPVEYSIGTISLKAGVNTLVFGNLQTSGKTDRCPYISQVTVSQ
jgi:hypothetical protein